MKTLFLPLALLILASCNTTEQNVKTIIDDSYFGTYGLKKMSDINKLDEDIYSLTVHSSIITDFTTSEVKTGNEFKIVRYIFKTDKGVYRMFYLLDISAEVVLEKSNDFDAFFEPIASAMLKTNVSFMKGDNVAEIIL
jgi:hypothetical protein